MNISRENIDALNAVVTIEIAKADYEPKVDAALKNYRKKAAMPGFRPGHVPAAMVKKMYGKSILADELNRMVGEAISGYIKDNELDILGEPMPSESQEVIDFDKDIDTVTFKFDLGLSPVIDLELNDKISVPYYELEVTDAAVDQQRSMLTARFAKNESVEAVGAESMVRGTLSQEGGYTKEASVLATRNIKDEEIKNAFLGKKVGEAVTFDIRKAYADDSSYIAYALGVSKEEADEAKGEYTFSINDITEYKDAELNQELFDGVFGEGKVTSVDEFNAKVRELVKTGNATEEEYRFALDVQKALLGKVNVELPEAFLKRWIVAVNQNNDKATPEVIENEFPRFLEDLKWQVVKTNIVKKNSLKIEQSDLVAAAKKYTRAQFMQYGMGNVPDELLEKYAVDMLKNREQLERLTDAAANEVVVNFVKSQIKVETKTVNRDEFNKLFEAEA